MFRICVINSAGQGIIDSALPKLVTVFFSVVSDGETFEQNLWQSDSLRLSTGHFGYMYHSPLFWCSIAPVSIQCINQIYKYSIIIFFSFFNLFFFCLFCYLSFFFFFCSSLIKLDNSWYFEPGNYDRIFHLHTSIVGRLKRKITIW